MSRVELDYETVASYEVVRSCIIIEFISSLGEENRIGMIRPEVDTQE